MNILNHIATRVFGCPLAIHPAKFEVILGAIGDRLGVEASIEQIEAAAKPVKGKANGYQVTNGVAIIPITGSLMKKTSGLMAASGATAYETIGAQFADAMNSPAIKGVLLDIDSPGGETSSLFELAEMMASYSGDKPVYAIADDAAFSAAYALASIADKLFLTRTAGVGSIGVFCAHVDQSQADQKAGTKYTFIHAGDKKVDGNSHQPLSTTALNDTQAEVDRQYAMFVSLVATNRNVSQQDIIDTQAGCLYGENAIPLLADEVGTFEDALADLQAAISQPASTKTSVKKAASLNINSQPEKADEVTQMAKKTDTVLETTIDELVAQAAIEAKDEIELTKASDEEAESKKKAADPTDEDCDDDEEDDKKDGAKGKTSHAAAIRIVNLCSLAGLPALASTFLTNDFTVEQVEKALLKHRAEKSKSVKIASASISTPAADFASTAKAIMNDDTIKDKAAAYRKHLMADPQAYLQTMLHRDNGEQYTFLKKRGY